MQILIWVNWFLKNAITRPIKNKVYLHFAYLEEHLLAIVRLLRSLLKTLTYLWVSDHCGVVRAFLDAGLLPRVVTGTSAGGLIAALTCTRTDEELTVLLDPELANKITACEDRFSVWFKRLWQTGARFDSVA